MQFDSGGVLMMLCILSAKKEEKLRVYTSAKANNIFSRDAKLYNFYLSDFRFKSASNNIQSSFKTQTYTVYINSKYSQF